jgi:autotransporter-associated beta strand protein
MKSKQKTLVSWAGSDVHGFLLTGQTNAIATYQLPQHYRFLLGNDYGYSKPAFGSAEGQAALVGSEISCWNSTNSGRDSGLWMLVRDGSLVLGTVGAPVKFTASTGSETKGNTGLDLPATPLVDFGRSVPLTKRGTGTLVLSNVVYTLVDGTGDATSKFVWNLGNYDVNLDAGVLRETGTGPSNSIRNMAYFMNGGIFGLIADYSGVAGTNTPAGEINIGSPWGNGSWVNFGGGNFQYYNSGSGFGAYGGRRIVTVTPKSGSKFTWGSTAVASDYFVANGAPLMLNAPDSDGEIVLATTSTNYMTLGGAAQTITVYDNPSTNTDWATLSIPIIDASASAALVKAGNGLLNLSATNNNWAGVTLVSNGTLNVNGAILAKATNVIVYSGATLGGTGTIMRAVSVLNGGTLTAGAGSNQTGTLTISSNLVLAAGATVSVNVGGTGSGQYSVIAVGGSNVVSLTGVTLAVNLNGYDLAGGSDLTIMTTPSGFGGTTFTSVTQHGYSARFSGNNLLLHRDSPGLTIRVQ